MAGTPLFTRAFGEKLLIGLLVLAAGGMGWWTWRHYRPAVLPSTVVPAEPMVSLPAGQPAVAPAAENVQVIYHGAGLRDPFVSLLPKVGSVEDASSGPVALPSSLVLQGIVWGDVEPSAIIDRRVVKAGDTVAGAQVMSIDPQGVMVLYRGQTFLLKPLH